jgi:cytochrome c
MSDLRFNTIAGTVLGSLLLVMGLREAGSIVFHPHVEKEPAVKVNVEAQATATAAAPEAPKRIDWGRLLGDSVQLASLVEAGDKAHKACLTCHSDKPDGSGAKTGPSLYGVFNRRAGGAPGFGYSAAMREYGQDWSYENLYAFLKAPKSYISGTSMAYAGVRSSDDRVAIVAYLRNLTAPNAPLPAPLPEEAAAPAAEGAAAPAEGAASAGEAPAAEKKAG